MPAASSQTLERLRRGIPEVQWFLAVAPCGDPIFHARVNDATIVKGTRTIAFDGTVGNWTDVKSGMTLWVGNSSGTYDVGRVRIKSIVPGSMEVAENDDIPWKDDLFLTVPGEAGFREPWSVLPRLTESGGTATFYKDYDRVFVNEGDHLPPKANGGPPTIGEIDPTTGHISLNWIGEDSYATELGEGISGTFWTFPGGTPASSTTMGTRAAPLAVTWNSPGFRYVELRVVDSLGTTGTTYIPTWIFDERTNNTPYNRVEVTDITSNLDGTRIGVRVFGADPIDFADQSLVALGVRSWFGGEDIEIGGFPHRENVYATGWIVGSTITFDANSESISFEIASTDAVLRVLPGFSFYLRDDAAPASWIEMDTPTADKTKHYNFEYHTTINQIAHVNQFGEGATREYTERGFPDANPMDQTQVHMYDGTMNTIGCDRQGIWQVTRDPQMMITGSRNAVPIVCDLVSEDGRSDWIEEVDVIVRHRAELGEVELGGFRAASTTPLISRAPGTAPSQNDASARLNGHVLEDQTEANRWSGLTWSKAANRFPEIHIMLKGFWPIFEPILQEYVRVMFEDSWGVGPDVPIRAIVREVRVEADQFHNTAITEVVVEAESMQIEGVTVTIPAPPAPAPTSTPAIGPIPPGFGGELKKVILRTSQGFIITTDFEGALPTWEFSNNNLTVAQRTSMRDMDFDFSDGSRLFAVSDDNAIGGAFRCSDIFNQAAWEQRFTPAHLLAAIQAAGGQCTPGGSPSYTATLAEWWAVGVDPASGHILFIGGFEDNIGCGDHKRVLYSSDHLATYTVGDGLWHDPFGNCGPDHCQTPWAGAGSITSWDGVSLFSYSCGWASGSDRHRGVSSNGGALVDTSSGQIWGNWFQLWHTRVGSQVIFYTDDIEIREIAVSSDHGVSYTIYSNILPANGPNDSGQALTLHFMDINNAMFVDTAEDVFYSADAAFTWAACPTSPDGAYCVAACADPSRIPDGKGFIVGCRHPTVDTSWLWLTEDHGQSFINKTSNLEDLLDHNSDIIYEIIPVQD